MKASRLAEMINETLEHGHPDGEVEAFCPESNMMREATRFLTIPDGRIQLFTDSDENPAEGWERHVGTMWGVFATEDFGPMAIFLDQGTADQFAKDHDGCDVVVLECRVECDYNNRSMSPRQSDG